VPRFMAGLQRIGAAPTRVPAYLTTPGLPGKSGLEACAAERRMLEEGEVAAIIFSSTAEVGGWWWCMVRVDGSIGRRAG